MIAQVAELTASSVAAGGFVMAGEYVFFLRQDEGAGVPVLAVRTGDGERVVLDPARPGAIRRRGRTLRS